MPADYVIYYLLVTVTTVVCWLCFAQQHKADKIISILMLVTLVEEIVSYCVLKVNKSNLPVYHFYSPVEFLLISLYFNYSLELFYKWNIGIIMGGLGIIFGAANTLFIQNLNSINSYFLLFEGTIIIAYCLMAFHQILLDEEHLPYRFANFWIAAFLLLYWGITFTGWGVYASTYNHKFALNTMFIQLLKISNYLFYAGLAVVFLSYKKLIPSGSNA
jgi:hypothetical protein